MVRHLNIARCAMVYNISKPGTSSLKAVFLIIMYLL